MRSKLCVFTFAFTLVFAALLQSQPPPPSGTCTITSPRYTYFDCIYVPNCSPCSGTGSPYCAEVECQKTWEWSSSCINNGVNCGEGMFQFWTHLGDNTSACHSGSAYYWCDVTQTKCTPGVCENCLASTENNGGGYSGQCSTNGITGVCYVTNIGNAEKLCPYYPGDSCGD